MLRSLNPTRTPQKHPMHQWGPGVMCIEESLMKGGQKHDSFDPSQAFPLTRGPENAEEATDNMPSDH